MSVLSAEATPFHTLEQMHDEGPVLEAAYKSREGYHHSPGVEFAAATDPFSEAPVLREAQLMIRNVPLGNDLQLTQQRQQESEILLKEGQRPPFDASLWRRIWSKKLREHSKTRRLKEQELLHLYEKATSSTNSSSHSPSKCNFILITGRHGSCANELAQVLCSDLEAKRGHFVRGKFDSAIANGSAFKRPFPYKAFIEAFSELIYRIIEGGKNVLSQWCDNLHSKLCPGELRVLCSRIPALEIALARDEAHRSAGEVSLSTEEQKYSSSADGTSKKFIFAFWKFARAISSNGYPIVMQLENLHEADWCSIDVLLGLAHDSKHLPGLVILGTCPGYLENRAIVAKCGCREHDYLRFKQVEMEEACGGYIPTISVPNLSAADVSDFLSNTFSLQGTQNEGFARMVMAQTAGNQLYLLEFVEWMCVSGHLKVLDADTVPLKVSWDGVTNTAINGFSHYDFLCCKLQQLETDEKDVLKVASCLGFRFERPHVEYILGCSVSSILIKLVKKGILLQDHMCSEVFNFCHDRLQHAAYSIITQNERNLFHLEVGRRLWRKMDPDAVDRHLFLFLSQMHIGRELIGREKEQIAVATLCLHAGQKAARSSSFRIALVYFNFGIEMLPRKSWMQEYELSLALFTGAAEMDFCASNFENAINKVSTIMENARSYNDTVQASATKMMSLSAQNGYRACVQMGMEVLEKLGVRCPTRITKVYLLREMMSIDRFLWRKSDEQILRMPNMTDETHLRILHILSLIFFPTIADLRPDLTAFVILKSMKITMEYGLGALSSFAFVSYGYLKIRTGRIKAGTRYGKVGLKLLDHFQSFELLPRVSGFYYGFIHPWRRPMKEALDPLLHARDVAFQTGDFEFAALSGHTYGWISVDCGLPLEGIIHEWTKFREFLRKNHSTLVHMAESSLRLIHHFLGKTDDIYDFGEGGENDGLKWDRNDIEMKRMKLAYLFGDIKFAEENICLEALDKIPPGFQRVSVSFLTGLVLVECARRGRSPQSNIRIASRLMRNLRKWANVAPHNFSDKAFLLEAELASFRGKNTKAYRDYLYSINMAKGSGNFFMTGLTNECFAKHLVNLGNLEEARGVFEDALLGYESWQGYAKVRSLKEFVRGIYHDFDL